MDKAPFFRRKGWLRPALLMLPAIAWLVGDARASRAADANTGPIALVAGDLTDTFFSALKKGADDAARDLNVRYTYVAANLTGPDLAKALQAAVASNPAGIAFGDWFPSAEDPIVAAAVKRGIPVVAVNSAPANWADTGAFAFIGQNDYQAGVLGGALLAKAGAQRALCINQSPGSQNLEQRCAGFAEAMKKAGQNATVLSIPYADATNPGKVIQAIQGALSGDAKIDALFGLGASIAVHAVRAVEQQGVAGKVKIGSVDLSRGLLDLINAGKVEFTIDQQPYLQGYYAIAILAQEQKYGLHLVGNIPTGPAVIDKTNVARVIKINQENRGVRGAF